MLTPAFSSLMICFKPVIKVRVSSFKLFGFLLASAGGKALNCWCKVAAFGSSKSSSFAAVLNGSSLA